MNIYVSGRGQFTVQVAEALVEAHHHVVGVASPRLRDGHSDESQAMSWDRLRAWAYPRNITWTDSSELRAHHIAADVDIILAAHSHAFIGRRTRARARVATIGYHPSLLPLHRGRDAIRWTIRDGDKVTGGTVYHLTEHTDGGPIAAQEHVLVPPGSTAQSLWREHLAPLGIRLLLRVVDDLADDRRIEVPQDEALATWEPSMDSPPLFKPELIALPGSVPVDSSKWALHGQEGRDHSRPGSTA
ncbi:formyltransferase family protein [Streptomyces lincolnensis]|uniref:formyltransferase family protein n=1 Tax=Streptomyces lincolnensis TaxID=1915 RepID=UPI0037D38156